MIRLLNIVVLFLVVGLSVTLYNLKYRIEAQKKQLARIEQKILNEEDAVRILVAEQGYLTQPDRLQALSKRHLMLTPMQASQVATFDELPMPPQDNDMYGPQGKRMGGYASSTLPGSLGGPGSSGGAVR